MRSSCLVLVCGHPLPKAPRLSPGTVTDARAQVLPYTNVVVVRAADSTFVVGGVAAGDGRFQLPAPGPGRYRLRVMALGYRRWQSPAFEVAAAASPKDFGAIELQIEGQRLQEVVVQGTRPTVVQLADRLVVNVEGTALAAGNTAFDVLARAPGVFIDSNGAIQLNGKAGVQVMLDGKLTYFSAKELQTILQAMSADNIKDLELIANPSAKYDAAGTAGIININLKKNQLGGLNGSVNAGGQYNGRAGVSAGGVLNYKRGAWNTFATLDLARRPSIQTRSLTRLFSDLNQSLRFEQNGTERGYSTTPAFRAGTDWTFRPGHSLGTVVNVLAADQDDTIRTNTSLRSNAASTNQYIQSDNRAHSRLRSGTFNLYYLGKLDTVGTTLAADLDYVTLSRQTASAFANRTLFSSGLPERFQLLTSDNPVRYDIYSAKLDLVKPLTKKTKLEAGAKASQVTSDNELLFYTVLANRPQLDISRTNHFLYREKASMRLT